MKKILFIFLCISGLSYSQNKAIDTMMIDGTQPATILKLNNHKIYILQNKELATPYKLQKDGSFVSNGVPHISVAIDKESTSLSVNDFFNDVKLKSSETKEIVKSDDKSVFIKTSTNREKSNELLTVLYPLSDRYLTIYFSFDYSNEDDKSKKYYAIRNIVEKGLIVLENYYKYRKM